MSKGYKPVVFHVAGSLKANAEHENTYKCPFCSNGFYLDKDKNYFVSYTISKKFETPRMSVPSMPNFSKYNHNQNPAYDIENADDIDGCYAIKISYYICPICKKTSIIAEDEIGNLSYEKWNLYPDFVGNVYPDYIPQAIRADYEEACKIVYLSPKASATLSRRCLQGIIRDFYEIRLKDNRLCKEIDAIKDKVDDSLWNAFDAVRKIGNIGAHMETDVNVIIDVDENEAQILITLLELVIKETYINKYERDRLLNGLVDIAKDKAHKK